MKNSVIKIAIIFLFLIVCPLSIRLSSGNLDTGILKTERGDIVIAIDIGHSKKTPGANSSRGEGEFYFNLNIARRLLKELLLQGYTKSFLINEDGQDINLMERAKIAEDKSANLLISIHHDSVQPHYIESWKLNGKKLLYCDLYSGYSLFYSQKNKEAHRSFIFAGLLGKALRNNEFVPTLHHAEPIKGENRELADKYHGIYRVDDFVIIKSPKMPAILVECGIIINRDEEILLSNPVYQKMFINSIIQSIEAAYIQGFFSN